MNLLKLGLMAIGALSLSCADTDGGQRDSSFAPTWTVCVFLAADNNLERYEMDNVIDMSRGEGPHANNTWIVQIDRTAGLKDKGAYSGKALLNLPNFTQTKRFQVVKGGLINVKDLGELDSDDPEVLRQFIEDCINKNPSEHYALILSDHGRQFYGFGDDETNDSKSMHLSKIAETVKIALAKTKVPRFDLIGMDACLMGGIEVAYEFHEVADAFIGSPELSPGRGWPFDEINEDISEKYPTTGLELGTLISVAFNKDYTDRVSRQAKMVTSTVFNLSDKEALSSLLTSIRVLAANLEERIAIEKEDGIIAIEKARYLSLDYGFDERNFRESEFQDLGDFTERIALLGGSKNDVQEALKKVAVSGSYGLNLKDRSGVSFFFPSFSSEKSTVSSLYLEGIFSKDSGWGEFLKKYQKAFNKYKPKAPVIQLLVRSGKTITAEFSSKKEFNHLGVIFVRSGKIHEVISILEVGDLQTGKVSYDLNSKDIVVANHGGRKIPLVADKLHDSLEGSQAVWEIFFWYQTSPGKPFSLTVAYYDENHQFIALFGRENDGLVGEIRQDSISNGRVVPLNYVASKTHGKFRTNIIIEEDQAIPASAIRALERINIFELQTNSSISVGVFAEDYFGQSKMDWSPL